MSAKVRRFQYKKVVVVVVVAGGGGGGGGGGGLVFNIGRKYEKYLLILYFVS